MNYPLTSDGKDKLIRDLETQIQQLTNEKKQLEEENNILHHRFSQGQMQYINLEYITKLESENQSLKQKIEKIKEKLDYNIPKLDIYPDSRITSNKEIQNYLKELNSILDEDQH